MAKTTNCAFCGKELTTGFFKGNAGSLDIGEFTSLTCCAECLATYQAKAKRAKERFDAKLHNYKASTKKKLSDEEIAKLFVLYLEEEEQQKAKGSSKKLTNYVFFCADEEGHFYVKEFKTGFSNEDVSINKMAKSLDKVEDRDCYCFDKNDITRIEYRMVSKIGTGDLFHKAHSFEIRLNDEKEFTYKPCITRFATVGTSLVPHIATKKAKKLFVEGLELFKKTIQSDLPIVEVKKFK